MRLLRMALSRAVEPGRCSCECAGCDAGYGHCGKKSRGCEWKVR